MTDGNRTTMTALMASSGGSWRQRTDVPRPTPQRGQVLLRVSHAALNNADVVARDAPTTPDDGAAQVVGYEVVGSVAEVGAGVDRSLLESRVMASTTGAFAQYAVADARHCLHVPEGLEPELAAALPTALLTEHGALRAGGFSSGQTVLVTGATSAIALVGVQVAKALGAGLVVGTTRSAAKADLLRTLGVDDVVTNMEHLPARIKEMTAGEGVDLVLDHVGGTAFAQAVRSVRKFGTIVQVGRLGGAEASIDLDALSYGRITVRGVSFGEAEELAELLSRAGEEVLPHVAAGRVRPVVDEVLNFDAAPQAVERVRDGSALGKVVLRVP